jgi:hypothetical protein
MSSQSAPRSPLPLVATICLVLVIALGASSYDQYFRSPLLEHGDIAVNALQVDNAKHFRELYGNYSRFEFNHPGPAFFYMYAAGEWLLHDLLHVVPSPGNAQLLTSMFVQSFFFALALGLIAVHMPGRLWLGLTGLAAALYFGALQTPFMSIWPPHVLLMPFLGFLVACCSLATGRFNHLPWVVLSGGFLFHGHVAQPLFVGSLGALSLCLGGWRLRQESPGDTWRDHAGRQRRWLWTAGALAALFALPLVIDVLIGGTRSNVATIIGRFYANTGDSKTLVQSFLYFVSFATSAGNQDEIFTTMGPAVGEFFRQHSGRVAIWAAILLLGPCLAFVLPARVPASTRRFLLTSHLILGVTIPVCVLWGIAQAGPMMNFNSYFYYGIYFFGLVLVLCWIDSLASLPQAPAVTAALCAIAAVVATWQFRMSRWSENDAGLPIKRAVAAALAEGTPGPRILTFEHAHWPAVASLALELQRKDVPFYMAPWWGFMFGYRHNLARLGDNPEDAATVWWITGSLNGEGGIPLNDSISIYTKPALLRPAGDVISFQGAANGFRYLVSGLSAGNMEYAQTELPRMVLVFEPGPADRDVQLDFKISSNHAGMPPHPGVVYFNGREVARLIAGEMATHSVLIPRDLWNSQHPAKVEIRFPEAVHNRNYKRPRHEWWTAWNVWSIQTAPAP